MVISFGNLKVFHLSVSQLDFPMDFLSLVEGISIQTVLKPPTDGKIYLIVSTINLNVLKIKNNDPSYINTVSNNPILSFSMVLGMGVVWNLDTYLAIGDPSFIWWQIKKQGKQDDTSQFRTQLDALGLRIVAVTADGNCFFRSAIMFHIRL